MKSLIECVVCAAGPRILVGFIAALALPACAASDDGEPVETVNAAKQEVAVQQRLDHVLVGTDGSAWQTIRYPDHWDQYRRVPTTGLPASRIGYLTEEAQGDSGTKGVHYMTITSGHKMYHAIRYPDGTTWSPWRDASAATNAQIGIQYAVMADDGVNLQVCAVGDDARLYHTARFSAANNWQQLVDTTGVLGLVQTAPWSFDCAASSRGLYVAVITNGHLWWGRRNPDSTWRRITAVPTNGLPSGRTPVMVSITADPQGKMFAVMLVDTALYFATMTPGEIWSSWSPIPNAPQSPIFLSSSLAYDGVDVQFAVVGDEWPNPGTAWHAIWNVATSTWSPFGRIQDQAGQRTLSLFTATAAAMK